LKIQSFEPSIHQSQPTDAEGKEVRLAVARRLASPLLDNLTRAPWGDGRAPRTARLAPQTGAAPSL
jgi:hypothetical protein